MLVSELKKRLERFNDDDMVIIKAGDGWCNIEKVAKDGINVAIECEESPIFSDN